jgi:hypothetical protein
MKRFIPLLFLFVHGGLYAQVQGEVELAGFMLGQSRKSVHKELGRPIERRITDDKWVYEFHALHKDTSVYALFKYAAWDTTTVYSIQVNGDHFPEMHTFRGVKLGSKAEEVFKVFGKSDEVENVDDPPLTVHYYKNRNYSFEIDNTGHLYGIQVYGKILGNKVKEGLPTLHGFHNAVVSKNIDSLLVHIAPDIEIHHGQNIYRIEGGARHEFHKHDSEFVKHMLGDVNSVWYAFAKEFAEGQGELKHHGEGIQSTVVFKFFDSSIISDLTLIPHAGRWKVYEIRFR